MMMIMSETFFRFKDNNNEIRVNNLIATAYIKKSRYKEAENILLNLIKKHKGLELAYLNLSILYRDKNQLNKSIKIVLKLFISLTLFSSSVVRKGMLDILVFLRIFNVEKDVPINK